MFKSVLVMLFGIWVIMGGETMLENGIARGATFILIGIGMGVVGAIGGCISYQHDYPKSFTKKEMARFRAEANIRLPRPERLHIPPPERLE